MRASSSGTEHHTEAFVLTGQLEQQRAPRAAARASRRLGQARVLEHDAELTEHHVADASFEVARPGPGEAGDHGGAKHRLLGREWIGDAHTREPRVQEIELGVTHERRRPGFEGARVHDHVAHVSALVLARGEAPRIAPGGTVPRETAIPVETGDLFDHVGATEGALAHVEASTRGGHHQRLAVLDHGELETPQDRGDLVLRERDPQESLDVNLTQRDRGGCGYRARNVEGFGEPLEFGHALSQDLDVARHRARRQLGVDPAFVSMGGLAT